MATASATLRRTRRACPQCRSTRGTQNWQDGSNVCSHCHTLVEAYVFTPLRRRGQQAEALADQSEASCGKHPGNTAVAACDSCGLFICALCRLPGDDDQVLCPDCFERLSTSGALASTRTQIHNYGLMAGLGGLTACLLFPLAPVLFLLVCAYFIKNRRQNRHLGERIGRAAGWTGLVCGALGALGGIAFWLSVITEIN